MELAGSMKVLKSSLLSAFCTLTPSRLREDHHTEKVDRDCLFAFCIIHTLPYCITEDGSCLINKTLRLLR